MLSRTIVLIGVLVMSIGLLLWAYFDSKAATVVGGNIGAGILWMLGLLGLGAAKAVHDQGWPRDRP